MEADVRVLMISKACLVGAYQRKLEEIAAFDDVELTVVTPPSWRDERGEIRLERAHLSGYTLAVEPIVFNGNFHMHFYPRLGRQFKAVRPDVVHIDEEPYNLATWHALWLARRVGARALFFSWQNIARRYPFPFSRGERWVQRNADYGIAGTQGAAAVWRAKGYTGPLAVIPQFGVDTALFTPGGARQPGRPFVIGYAGRLVEEKGVDLLLEAASGLPGGWRLDVLGSGPAQAELETLAGRLGIANRVTYTAWTSSDRMPDFYRRVDVLAVPSRTRPNWKEQFGRVIVEAMACGTPVVGSDSGAIPEVIGEAGLVFPEDGEEALRGALARLMEDTALWARLSAKGRAWVEGRFTQAQVAAETVRVYREMVAKR
jgi:glycosyltransferase involved in cell wall biosynthesis